MLASFLVFTGDSFSNVQNHLSRAVETGNKATSVEVCFESL